jgi:hypothetical protein
MKQRREQTMPKSSRLSSKSIIALALAAIVLTAGAVTALSMRSGQSKTEPVEERKAQAVNQRSRHYVTSNASGQTVVVDQQTGQVRPLTPEEARRLAEGIKQLVNQSTEGLVQVHHSNGMVSMNLQGRFQNVSLAKKEADGSISQACVDNVDSAGAFFEIDPDLLGSHTPVSKSQPATKFEIR